MISKTKIANRTERKRNPEIAETVFAAKKQANWMRIAQLISGPRRKYASVNLKTIEEQTTAGDTIIVPGKVLGKGDITKQVRVCAINFSESAREKLKKNKGEIVTILEEIKKNPKAEGIKLIQ